MSDIERHALYRKIKPTSAHLDAIEGLIFDPQPLTDLQIEIYGRRFKRLVITRFTDEAALGRVPTPEFMEPSRDLNDNLPHSVFDVTYRYPPVMIDAGPNRTFMVKLLIARNRLTLLQTSALGLKDFGSTHESADYFMTPLGVARSPTPVDLARPYIPNFTEQQRLLLVADFLTQTFRNP